MPLFSNQFPVDGKVGEIPSWLLYASTANREFVYRQSSSQAARKAWVSALPGSSHKRAQILSSLPETLANSKKAFSIFLSVYQFYEPPAIARLIHHGKEDARSPQKQKFHYISADLTSGPEAERIISEATAVNNDTPPDIVWCCAGSSYPTLFVDTPIEQLRNMMDSNYFSSAYVAHATLRSWLKPTPKQTISASSSPRHLIFTASLLSFFTLAGYGPYSPTKAALRSLSDTLSQEMNLYASSSRPPVRLHTVFPATIFTESYEAENRVKSDLTKYLEEGDSGQTADEVAKRSIVGLEKGEELVPTTFQTRLLMTSVLGGSIRNGWALLDTVLSWVMSLAMVFVRSDMDSKVQKWRKEHGESGMKKI